MSELPRRPYLPPPTRPYVEALEDRAFLLEDALHQAQSTVEFLHGCLTEDGYDYSFPEQTLNALSGWAELAPRPPVCVHSFDANRRYGEGTCEGCASRDARFRRRAEIAGRDD